MQLFSHCDRFKSARTASYILHANGPKFEQKTESLPFASHMLVSIHMTYQLIPSAHQISRYNNNNNNNNTRLTALFWDYPGEPVRER